MNWREEFDCRFETFYDIGTPDLKHPDEGSEVEHFEALKDFIQEEVIKPLIADIPEIIEEEDRWVHTRLLKQELKSKWINETM